jgi:para-nitrobenzyl esterase
MCLTLWSLDPPEARAQDYGTAAADGHYSTADTPIGVLLDDPAAKAILDKYVPALTRSPRAEIRPASLKAIQGYALAVLSDEVLARIDADLVKLTPIAPVPPSRTTLDQTKVKPYSLPDPLTLANGQGVHDARTW